MNIKALIIATAAIVAAGGTGYSLIQSSNAEDQKPVATSSVTKMSKSEIETIVRNYLTENPEVIIDALRAYDEKQVAMAEAEARESIPNMMPALLSQDDGYVAGADPKKAKVAVIELFDYHCGFCKRATGLMQDIIKDDEDVTVVFRELPILREESQLAAELALAARDQGKFEELHFGMMKASGILDQARIEGIAKRTGLNVDELLATHKNTDYSQSFANTKEIARTLGIGGTPAFIVTSIDGSYSEIISGFQPQEVKKAIKKARKAG